MNRGIADRPQYFKMIIEPYIRENDSCGDVVASKVLYKLTVDLSSLAYKNDMHIE